MLCTEATKILGSINPWQLSDSWLHWGRENAAGGGRPKSPGSPRSPRQYLSDVGQPYDVGHDAHHGDEELAAVAQQLGELVHQGSDEPFHGAELQGKAQNTVQSPAGHGLWGSTLGLDPWLA